MSLLGDLRSELRAEFAAWPGGWRDVLNNRGLRAVLIYRLDLLLTAHRIPLLPTLLAQANLMLHGIDIERGAVLGRRVQFAHPQGVVIGAGAVIEDGVLIESGVTLGKKLMADRPEGYPRICASAHLGSGVKVIGPVRVGERAEVGANSVVTRDVEPWTVVAGVPARWLRDRPR